MTSPEAPLLTQMNALKQINFHEYLTDAQQTSLDAIHDHRDAGEPYINLYGPPKAGKTFLCWALQSEGWTYHQAIPERVNNPTAIYDHGKPDQRATRELRNNAELNGIACVLYVTRKEAEEVFPRVELAPTTAHYEAVAANWEKVGLDPEDAPTQSQSDSTTGENTV
jgi:hypothetical protein